MKKLKYWWMSHNLPFITTARKVDDEIIGCMKTLERLNNMMGYSTVRPVIHSLKELRKNTWDIERVDRAIEWLEENFKFEEIK